MLHLFEIVENIKQNKAHVLEELQTWEKAQHLKTQEILSKKSPKRPPFISTISLPLSFPPPPPPPPLSIHTSHSLNEITKSIQKKDLLEFAAFYELTRLPLNPTNKMLNEQIQKMIHLGETEYWPELFEKGLDVDLKAIKKEYASFFNLFDKKKQNDFPKNWKNIIKEAPAFLLTSNFEKILITLERIENEGNDPHHFVNVLNQILPNWIKEPKQIRLTPAAKTLAMQSGTLITTLTTPLSEEDYNYLKAILLLALKEQAINPLALEKIEEVNHTVKHSKYLILKNSIPNSDSNAKNSQIFKDSATDLFLALSATKYLRQCYTQTILFHLDNLYQTVQELHADILLLKAETESLPKDKSCLIATSRIKTKELALFSIETSLKQLAAFLNLNDKDTRTEDHLTETFKKILAPRKASTKSTILPGIAHLYLELKKETELLKDENYCFKFMDYQEKTAQLRALEKEHTKENFDKIFSLKNEIAKTSEAIQKIVFVSSAEKKYQSSVPQTYLTNDQWTSFLRILSLKIKKLEEIHIEIDHLKTNILDSQEAFQETNLFEQIELETTHEATIQELIENITKLEQQAQTVITISPEHAPFKDLTHNVASLKTIQSFFIKSLFHAPEKQEISQSTNAPECSKMTFRDYRGFYFITSDEKPCEEFCLSQNENEIEYVKKLAILMEGNHGKGGMISKPGDWTKITCGDLNWLSSSEKKALSDFIMLPSFKLSTETWPEVVKQINQAVGNFNSKIELKDILNIAEGIIFRNSSIPIKNRSPIQKNLSLPENEQYSLEQFIQSLATSTQKIDALEQLMQANSATQIDSNLHVELLNHFPSNRRLSILVAAIEAKLPSTINIQESPSTTFKTMFTHVFRNACVQTALNESSHYPSFIDAIESAQTKNILKEKYRAYSLAKGKNYQVSLLDDLTQIAYEQIKANQKDISHIQKICHAAYSQDEKLLITIATHPDFHETSELINKMIEASPTDFETAKHNLKCAITTAHQTILSKENLLKHLSLKFQQAMLQLAQPLLNLEETNKFEKVKQIFSAAFTAKKLLGPIEIFTRAFMHFNDLSPDHFQLSQQDVKQFHSIKQIYNTLIQNETKNLWLEKLVQSAFLTDERMDALAKFLTENEQANLNIEIQNPNEFYSEMKKKLQTYLNKGNNLKEILIILDLHSDEVANINQEIKEIEDQHKRKMNEELASLIVKNSNEKLLLAFLDSLLPSQKKQFVIEAICPSTLLTALSINDLLAIMNKQLLLIQQRIHPNEILKRRTAANITNAENAKKSLQLKNAFERAKKRIDENQKAAAEKKSAAQRKRNLEDIERNLDSRIKEDLIKLGISSEKVMMGIIETLKKMIMLTARIDSINAIALEEQVTEMNAIYPDLEALSKTLLALQTVHEVDVIAKKYAIDELDRLKGKYYTIATNLGILAKVGNVKADAREDLENNAASAKNQEDIRKLKKELEEKLVEAKKQIATLQSQLKNSARIAPKETPEQILLSINKSNICTRFEQALETKWELTHEMFERSSVVAWVSKSIAGQMRTEIGKIIDVCIEKVNKKHLTK